MKVVKKIISIIIWILLFIVVAFNLYSFISTRVLEKEFTTINGYTMLKVDSGSMEPRIQVGDIIIIDTKPKKYKKHDIITYRDETYSYITHKIVKVTDEGFITKGDANDSVDQGYVQEEQIVGVYKGRIRHLAILFIALRNPFTAIMILISGILACILISIDKNGNLLDVTKEDNKILKYRKMKKPKLIVGNEQKESKSVNDTRVARLERKEKNGELPTVEELIQKDKKKQVAKKKTATEKTNQKSSKPVTSDKVTSKEKAKPVKGVNLKEKKSSTTTKKIRLNEKTLNEKEGE